MLRPHTVKPNDYRASDSHSWRDSTNTGDSLHLLKPCRSLPISYTKEMFWLGNISGGVTRPDIEDKDHNLLPQKYSPWLSIKVFHTILTEISLASTLLWREQSTDSQDLAANIRGYQNSQFCKKTHDPLPHTKHPPSTFQ